MDNLYARSVFFVRDVERSLRFYTEQLGFAEDWNVQEGGRTTVCQVSLFGFDLILNQVGDNTRTRAGHGRVFIGLEDDQVSRCANISWQLAFRPSAISGDGRLW